jgi:serralysin
LDFQGALSMASFTISNLVTTGQVLSVFDSGLITSTGILADNAGAAITATNSGTQVGKLTVLGTLMSQGNSTGKALDFVGAEFIVYIGAGGQVITPGLGTTAIDLDATDKVTITNFGSIFGETNAIRSGSGDSFSSFELLNTGDITGGYAAINFDNQLGSASVNNTGSIIGTNYGLKSVLGASNMHTTNLLNSGVIQGLNGSYMGSDGADIITNTGQMIGQIILNGGADTYSGSAGTIAGIVYGGSGNDKLIGGVSDDVLVGGNDNDILTGGGGNDILDGGFGDDVLRGGEGNDTLTGQTGVDILRGHQGDDTMDGGAENDTLKGGAGDDTLFGGTGQDDLFGGAGNDTLSGGSQKDTLRGGTGNDVLSGNTGNDTLNGGQGDDVLTGGSGSDVFVFGRNTGDDRITDFANTKDTIDLTAFGIKPSDFASIVTPALSNAGGGDTVLNLADLGGQGSVLIEGLAFADADASDFIL